MCQSVGSMERVCEGVVETYTPRGHVVGMLDRDQRTAKVPTYQKHAECQNFSEDPAAEQVCRGKVHSWKSRGWKSRVRETAQRLKQVLVVGTYLLSIISIPSSLSAPTGLTMDRLNSREKWINPCEMNESFLQDDQTGEVPVDVHNLLGPIINQAGLALNKAEDFKQEFINQLKTEILLDIYKDTNYGFLPSIPKRLGEKLPEDSAHLKERNINNSLIDIYENLQRIGVGLEAVTWGQEDTQGKFRSQFNDTELLLRSVLCEIQTAILELGLRNNMKPDIRRDVMDDKLRNDTDITSRYPRDWVIYREYMNALEYTIQVFEYLNRTMP